MNKQFRLSRRRFLKAALITGVGAGLAACQPVAMPEAGAGEEAGAPAEAITVRMWHHWGGDRVPLMDTQIADFMETYPNIEVEATLQPWGQRLEKLLASVSAGTPPDVTMLAQHDMAPFVRADALLPLAERMTEEGITLDEYYGPEALAMQREGNIWVLPNTMGGSQNLMFYVPADFEEVGLDPANPPATWADLLVAIEKLVVFEDEEIKRLGCTLYGGPDGFRHYMACNDAPMISEDGTTSMIDNERTVQSVQFMLDVMDAQGGIEKVAAWQSTTSAFETNPFYTGLKSINFSGGWNYFYVKAQAPELEYMSAICPVNNDSPWVGSYNYSWGYAIPNGTKEPDGAWTLVKWLSYDLEGSCEFMKAQLQAHPLKACSEQPEYQTASFWPVVEEATTRTKVYGNSFPVWNEVGDAMNTSLEEVYYHLKSPDEAVAEIGVKLQELLDEWWAEA
jgi:multiple sugar transport system substrate-binding protein